MTTSSLLRVNRSRISIVAFAAVLFSKSDDVGPVILDGPSSTPQVSQAQWNSAVRLRFTVSDFREASVWRNVRITTAHRTRSHCASMAEGEAVKHTEEVKRIRVDIEDQLYPVRGIL
jgi:hypothetical protein